MATNSRSSTVWAESSSDTQGFLAHLIKSSIQNELKGWLLGIGLCLAPIFLITGNGQPITDFPFTPMNEPVIRSFEDLDCREMRLFVAREVVPTLPKDENFAWATN